VTASESAPGSAIAPAALVDGLARNSRILPLREWLAGLAERHEISGEINLLEAILQQRSLATAMRLRWTLGIAFSSIAALLFLLYANRKSRRRHIAGLRDQIASDLHDEIGSNLGSIALVSEGLARKSEFSSEDRTLLADISGTARESSQTIRDIVWLLNTRADESDLILRLRQTAARMLSHMEYTFEVPNEEPSHFIPLEMRRHLLLFFKEALHNLVRHSRANNAAVSVSGHNGSFHMLISDNGIGLKNPADPALLQQLKSRARKIPGELTIESTPGQGTSLDLAVTLPGH
jgi:signal transduction histidine kinase